MPDPQKPRTFRGRCPSSLQGVYASLTTSGIAIRRLITLPYELIVQLVWSSFTQGRAYDFSISVVAIALFAVLSALFYSLRDYDSLLILALIGIWLIDYGLAQIHYRRARSQAISLSCRSQWCVWQMQLQPNDRQKFRLTDVRQIEIAPVHLRGGVFQVPLARAWQVALVFINGKLLFSQEQTAWQALQQGKDLAAYFTVPVQFAHSQGQNPYAAQPLVLQRLRDNRTFPSTIRTQSSSQVWRIDSQWRFSSFGVLLEQIFQEAGFLFFVVAIVNLMILVGKSLFTITAIASGQESFDPATLTVSGLLMWSVSDFDWLEVVEAAIAIGVLVLKGAELSREEHLRITKDVVQFSLDHQQIAEIPTQAIEATLFIEQPQPLLLILSDQQAIEIPGLQQEIEFRAMLCKLDEALSYF